jgi:predicted dinucleotide-binding enzyme
MTLNAQTLKHAREALATADMERQILAVQVREQGKKIVDLENEVQRQANLRSYTEQLLADAKREAEALRALLPDEATLKAFEELNRYVSAPEQQRHGLMRIAA